MSSDLETNIVSVERVKEYSETPTEVGFDLITDKTFMPCEKLSHCFIDVNLATFGLVLKCSFFFNCSGVYLILRLWCGCFFRLSGLFQIIDPQRTGPRQETLS